jgi:hypothetical protein
MAVDCAQAVECYQSLRHILYKMRQNPKGSLIRPNNFQWKIIHDIVLIFNSLVNYCSLCINSICSSLHFYFLTFLFLRTKSCEIASTQRFHRGVINGHAFIFITCENHQCTKSAINIRIMFHDSTIPQLNRELKGLLIFAMRLLIFYLGGTLDYNAQLQLQTHSKNFENKRFTAP